MTWFPTINFRLTFKGVWSRMLASIMKCRIRPRCFFLIDMISIFQAFTAHIAIGLMELHGYSTMTVSLEHDTYSEWLENYYDWVISDWVSRRYTGIKRHSKWWWSFSEGLDGVMKDIRWSTEGNTESGETGTRKHIGWDILRVGTLKRSVSLTFTTYNNFSNANHFFSVFFFVCSPGFKACSPSPRWSAKIPV